MKAYTSKSTLKPLVSGLLLAFTAYGLSGCASDQALERSMGETRDAVNEAVKSTNKFHDPMINPGMFQVIDGFHAATKPLEKSELVPIVRLPASFQRDASIDRMSATSLTDLASHVSKISGYRVIVESDLATESMAQGISYKGSLEGLLNQASGATGSAWRLAGDTITFYKYESRMFHLDSLAGITSVQAQLSTQASGSTGGGGGSGGSTGTSGQNINVQSSFDVWKDVSDSIKGILSSGGTYSVATSAGTITVRDTPQVLRVVEAQIREFNRIYSHQVQLDVQVYAIERTKGQASTVDWSAVWQQAAGKYGLSFGSNGAGGTVNGGSAPGFSAVINSGQFAGSSALISTLNSVGRTDLITSGTVSSLNGQTVPLVSVREQAYLQSYSTTLASGVGGTSTTTLTPGVVTEGFSMNITPRILPDNNVLLRYTVDLSSIDNIETYAAPDGNSAIQLPRRSTRNFMQNSSLRSGQTMVLTGFQQSGASSKSSGPFSAKAWALGGGKSSEELSRTIVIVITPTVVN